MARLQPIICLCIPRPSVPTLALRLNHSSAGDWYSVKTSTAFVGNFSSGNSSAMFCPVLLLLLHSLGLSFLFTHSLSPLFVFCLRDLHKQRRRRRPFVLCPTFIHPQSILLGTWRADFRIFSVETPPYRVRAGSVG